jgi:hypothetical protein
MIKCDPRYYSGCILLYGILSVTDYALEVIHSNRGVVERCGRGFGHYEPLAGWLFKEVFSCRDSGAGSDIESTDPLLTGWATRLRSSAAEIGKLVDSEVCLYYFTSRWGLRVLTEFDRLIDSIDSDEIQQRYRANYGVFEDLTTWLQNEIASIEEGEGTDEEEVNALRTTADAFVDQLAIEWNKEVQLLSERGYDRK